MGLGNPGSTYTATRHNAGFWVVDRLVQRSGRRWRRPWFRPYRSARWEGPADTGVEVVQPLTFMNNSGRVMPYFARCESDSCRLVVVTDNIDLPVGRLRLKQGSSDSVHNGIRSLRAATAQPFLRLFVGIGRPPAGCELVDYVLAVPPADERERLHAAVERACDGLDLLMQGEMNRAVECINKRPPEPVDHGARQTR